MRIYAATIIILIGLVSCFSGAKKDTKKGITDTLFYTNNGDPDTALALFLYTACYEYDFDLQREEYIRWHREKDTLIILYKALFGNKADYTARLDKVKENALIFLNDAIKAVRSDYKEYGAVSESMEVDFLYERREEKLKQILDTLVRDPHVDTAEVRYARSLLEDW